MSTRNFSFRVSPRHGERGGRYVLAGPTTLTSGVPVVTNGVIDAQGCAEVVIATGDQAKPKPGQGGILVFENIDSLGFDRSIYTWSDIDQVIPGDRVQVVQGTGQSVKVVFTNTSSGSYGTTNITRSNYPKARVMVAGVSQATPSIAIGDYLTPGVGTDASGYWAVTSTAANGWLVVTYVDSTTGVVEAEANF